MRRTRAAEAELFPAMELEPPTADLFPPPEPRELEHATGILPSQLLRDAIERTREIRALEPIGEFARHGIRVFCVSQPSVVLD